MASSIPEALKSADITRFATRAAQVERAKPAIAYWCYYWIVQQIVTRGLHKANEECMNYTTQLMDKLEVVKNTDDEAIKDEIIAKALIEQFGLDIFSKADNAVRANKASRQTADTFQAAATFLELLQIWPPLETEIAAKIKFAKYHAVRIAKAIKAGEDPNASNPAPEPEDEINGIDALDPRDPQVQALQDPHPPSQGPGEYAAPEQAHVFQDPNATFKGTSPIYSTGRSGPSSPHHSAENYYHTSRDVSPIGPPSVTGPPSIGGGYFPRASNDAQLSPTSDAMDLPPAPADAPDVQPGVASVNQSSPPVLPTAFSPGYAPTSATSLPSQPHPTSFQHQSIPAPQPIGLPYTPEPTHIVDDQAMNEATKHARWAISALNFEDVPTAIKELRGALELLGARGPW